MSTPTPGAAPQMAAETPLLKLPLKAVCFQAEDADGVPVFHCGLGLRPPSESAKQEARCAHIVHCVNTHESLVEELQNAVDLWDAKQDIHWRRLGLPRPGNDTPQWITRSRAALAKAKAGAQ